MGRTDKFREQHNELLNLANELTSMLDEAKLAQDATLARTCLSKLLGKLKVHLASEDNVLYPELQRAQDPAVVKLAKGFADEMKAVAPKVVAYSAHWPTPSSIKANPAGFVRETKELLGVLANRIKRENQELYVAADRLATHA